MSRHRRLLVALSLCAVAGLALAACASPAGGGQDASPSVPLGSAWPAPPEGEVVAQGTVMDVAGDVQLCLGVVMESYPPQCSGIPIELWSWDNLHGAETSGDVTWGAYAVQGTYDGDTFTMTQPPVMLALYDPMPIADPTGGEPGTTDEETLLGIQDDLHDRLGDALLVSGPQNGYLWVDVVWDDGTFQRAADDEFGEGVIVIRSAMRAV